MARWALWGIASAVGLLGTGCLFDHDLGRRPARFYAGPTLRAVNAAAAPDAPTRAARVASEPPASERRSAVTASLQFTMRTAFHTYAGGELEEGRFAVKGSNLAGAYGVVGTDHSLGFGSLGVELVAGWRGARYFLGDVDHDELVVEPRVRGQLWISEQWTLGGSFGARLGGAGEWMAGLTIGVHSHTF